MPNQDSAASNTRRAGKIIAAASAKGGVGKTSVVATLAAVLAESGTVLAVDADASADLTVVHGFDADQIPIERTVGAAWAAALEGTPGEPGVDDLAIPIEEKPGLRLCPSSADVARVIKMIEADNWGVTAIRDAVWASTPEERDWTIIDTPPLLGTYLLACLIAADWVIIPVAPDMRAVRGADRIIAEVGRIRSRGLNPNVRVVGLVGVGVDSNTNISRDLREHLGDWYVTEDGEKIPVLGHIPRSVRISEAAAAGKAITDYAPRHPAAEAWREVTGRLLELAKEEGPSTHRLS